MDADLRNIKVIFNVLFLLVSASLFIHFTVNSIILMLDLFLVDLKVPLCAPNDTLLCSFPSYSKSKLI